MTKIIDKNNVHIRRYREDDIDLVVNVICQEVQKLPHYKGVKVDPARVRFILQNALNDESTFMVHLLCDSHTDEPIGGIAGYCVTQLLSWDKVTGDVFLFVKPEWRSMMN